MYLVICRCIVDIRAFGSGQRQQHCTSLTLPGFGRTNVTPCYEVLNIDIDMYLDNVDVCMIYTSVREWPEAKTLK